MNIEREYVGKSDHSLQEALDKSLQHLAEQLGEGGIRDASASWVMTEIAGEYGGFAGRHSIKVTITAKRSPEWERS